ncbi:MAG: RluA family pseudouridine synthase, partial [Leptothrix sp. (in: b-proteobacteria)]
SDCVARRLQAQWPDALIVHRLDMSTSGLMVFARGLAAQRRLSQAFERREVDKTYVAVVAGQLEAASGSIDLPLGCDWPNRPRQQVDAVRGRPALTHWLRVDTDTGPQAEADTSRVELHPVTGRSHQLRVHLAAIGHPILGDALYASDAVRALAPRLLLHASQLVLPHPVSGERLPFNDPAPF